MTPAVAGVQQEPSNTPKKRSVALLKILAMLLQKSARQDEMVDFTQNIEETHGTPAAAAIRGTPQPPAAAMRGTPPPPAIKGTPPPSLVAIRGTPPPPPPPLPPPPPPQGKPAVVQTSHMTSPPESGVKYVHPFAMIVAGCTGSGKTYFVKDMLQSMRITPKPQRIIWLYKRWQPLYTTILNTVQPEVQFIQGIPPDLDQDSFVDPSVRNLLILDDLMSSAAKDPRVTDLFTEGSHHRNLSVTILSQNLYFSKDATQRRNAHYLVLFKSPVDKQQIKTLPRQMYPDRSGDFMNAFNTATCDAYGHLIVDLKPNTPEWKRLIKGLGLGACGHNAADGSKVHIDQRSEIVMDSESSTPTQRSAVCHSVPMLKIDPSEKPLHVCEDCGQVFAKHFDLHKHLIDWCPEGPRAKRRCIDSADNSDDETCDKWIKLDEDNARANGPKDNVRETRSFVRLWNSAREKNEDEWEREVKQLTKTGV